MKRTKLGRVWPPGAVLLVIVLLVALAITLGGPASAALQDPTISVSPAMKEGYPGETFSVAVLIEGAEDATGAQFRVNFNPDIVELSNPTDGGFFETPFSCSIVGGAASCTAVVSPPYDGGASGAGTLVTFDAQIVGRGQTALALDLAQVSDTDAVVVVPDTEDGMVSSLSYLQVEPSYMERSVPMGTFTETVTIYNAAGLAGFQFEMDFDATVLQVEDVVLVETFLESGGRTIDPGATMEIIDNDAGTLFFAGFSLPPGDGPDGDGALAHIVFDAIEKGDTDLDLHDAKTYDEDANEELPGDVDGIIHVVDEGIQVVPLHQEVCEGQAFSVDIEGGKLTDLAGYEFSLGFDETVLMLDSVEVGDFLQDVVSTTEVIDNVAGTVFFGAFALEGQTGDVGKLATLNFVAQDVDVDETSDLDLFNTKFYRGEDEILPTETDGDVLVLYCIPASIDDFVSDSPVYIGDTMYFTATVSGREPIEYTWDFGDGGAGTLVSGGEDTGAYLYDAAGTYTVTLTVENCCEMEMDEQSLVVEVKSYMLYLPLVALNASQ